MTKAPREVLATLLLAAAACSTSNRTVVQTAPKPATVHGDIANAKPDSSRFPFTEADVHFMSGMIHHHSQAIAMSKMAPTHDAGPSLRILAARIINAQGDEIALMSQW